MGDDTHVSKGCWAIDTVNGNCWARAAEYIRGTAVDFVVVQESRLQKGLATDSAESTMAAAKWKVSIGPCTITEAQGKASGVVVACRAHIGLGNKDATDTMTASKQLTSRLQPRHVGAAFRGDSISDRCLATPASASEHLPTSDCWRKWRPHSRASQGPG